MTLRLLRNGCFAFLLAYAGAGAHEHSVSTHVSPDGRVTKVTVGSDRLSTHRRQGDDGPLWPVSCTVQSRQP